MSTGYLYCFSNPHINLLKVGMTERTPDVRLSEANKESNEWTPGHFKLEFAKKVTNPRDKEKTLHAFLASKRVHGKEFFDISPDELMLLFRLLEGEMWVPTTKSTDEVSSDEDISKPNSVSLSGMSGKKKKTRGPAPGCRTMASQFTHGQRIQHETNAKTWYATYDAKNNRIVRDNGDVYNRPSNFAEAHIKVDHPTRKTKTCDGLMYCKYELNGIWESMHTLDCKSSSCPANCRKT